MIERGSGNNWWPTVFELFSVGETDFPYAHLEVFSDCVTVGAKTLLI